MEAVRKLSEGLTVTLTKLSLKPWSVLNNKMSILSYYSFD